MNRRLKSWLIFSSIILLSILGILLYPRSVEHGIFITKESKYATFFIDGKERKFSCNADFTKYSVVNFKYNLFGAFSFKEVPSITDRVMVKGDTTYDLEKLGTTALAEKTQYYEIDKDNSIKSSDSKKLIVGKNNIKAYKNSQGQLKTFLITPLDYSTMRVGISTTNFTSLLHEKSEIKCITPSKLYSIRDNVNVDLPKDSIINIGIEGNKLKVSVNGNPTVFNSRVYLKGNALSMVDVTRGYPSFIPSYSGVLEFTIVSNKLCIINEVDMEDYLRKVVPSEMPLSGGIEALKCQAIAARTYAISDMLGNRFSSLGFYVDDSTQSQVYNNIPIQTLSNEAVDTTKGIIMTYKNTPIDAKYYSTSAGTGTAYGDVWFRSDGSSENRPYLTYNNYLEPKQELPKSEEGWLTFYKTTTLKAQDSNYPYFRWHVEFSNAGLTKSLNKSLKILFEKQRDFLTITQDSKILNDLPELQDLQDIKVVNRSKGGNVMEISFIFKNATVNVKSDSCIRSALRCSSQYTGEDTAIILSRGNPLTDASFLPSSFFSAEKSSGKFIVYGGGYGHGVGMSQYGAIELSKSGMNYKDILDTFYKGINIEKIY